MHTQTYRLSSYDLIIICTGILFFFTPFAHAESTSTSTTARNNTKTADIACMSDAIDTREDTLIAAWEEMSSSTVIALHKRHDNLVDAWSLTSIKERTLALVKTWKEWRTEKKTITAEFRKDRKAAWDEFKKTAKDECKTRLPKEESLEKATSDSIAI